MSNKVLIVIAMLVQMSIASNDSLFGEGEKVIKEQSVQTNQRTYVREASETDRLVFERQKEELYAERIYIGSLAMLMFLSLLVMDISLVRIGATPFNLIMGSALIVIVFGTMISVLLAETEQQLTVTVGIFSAIVGYIFGSLKNKDQKES